MPHLHESPVTVRVPATSANLGPGFDSFGLALAAYDDVTAQVAGAGVRVEVTGEGSATLPRDEGNLVASSLLAALHRLGSRPPGLVVSCRNAIPQARGLGSSSAAIVAGISLADALAGGRLDRGAMLELATSIEGHPDNVAACIYGGFTICWLERSTPACVRLDPAQSICPLLFVPQGAALATPYARTMLPAEVPHADAASNAARAALLPLALTDRPELLWSATQDRLHQHYRQAAMPESLGLLRALRDDGIAAAISGAGPSVLAFAGHDTQRSIARHAPPGWTAQPLAVDREGAKVLPHAEYSAPECR